MFIQNPCASWYNRGIPACLNETAARDDSAISPADDGTPHASV